MLYIAGASASMDSFSDGFLPGKAGPSPNAVLRAVGHVSLGHAMPNAVQLSGESDARRKHELLVDFVHREQSGS